MRRCLCPRTTTCARDYRSVQGELREVTRENAQLKEENTRLDHENTEVESRLQDMMQVTLLTLGPWTRPEGDESEGKKPHMLVLFLPT